MAVPGANFGGKRVGSNGLTLILIPEGYYFTEIQLRPFGIIITYFLLLVFQIFCHKSGRSEKINKMKISSEYEMSRIDDSSKSCILDAVI